MTSLRAIWENLRGSLWFLPSLITLAAIVLAAVLVDMDTHLDVATLPSPWPSILNTGVDGARSMLVAIAGAMATIAGVTFSIIIVVLTLASSQYSSRVLRNFMRDQANQAVLGAFVGIFVYCLIVLRAIRGGEIPFVPAVSVLMAVLLALVAMGLFVYFIHHVSVSIQASNIIANIAEETLSAIERLYPKPVDEPEAAQSTKPLLDWIKVPALKTGYIQGVDTQAMHRLAQEHGLTLLMEINVGEFVTAGTRLASAGGSKITPEVVRALGETYTIGRQRTLHQDAAFGIRQLVDVALKALSPGINDTTTAINCVDYLGAILSLLATRSIKSSLGARDGLLIPPPGHSFDSMVGEAMDQIRQNAEGNSAVLLRLLDALLAVANCTTIESRRETLRQQVKLIGEAVQRTVSMPSDRHRLTNAEVRVQARLSA